MANDAVQVQQVTNLAIYDTMIAAIDDCYEVHVVKDIRDQAIALEHYAKQAHNREAERKTIEIRIRAERRVGQLLKKKQRSEISKGGDLRSESAVQAERPISEFQEAKADANISDTQAKRWQKLADVPEEKFEEKIQNSEVTPSTTGIITDEEARREHLEKMKNSPGVKWNKLIYDTLVHANSIRDNGGIAYLTSRWPIAYKQGCLESIRRLIDTFNKIAEELEGAIKNDLS